MQSPQPQPAQQLPHSFSANSGASLGASSSLSTGTGSPGATAGATPERENYPFVGVHVNGSHHTAAVKYTGNNNGHYNYEPKAPSSAAPAPAADPYARLFAPYGAEDRPLPPLPPLPSSPDSDAERRAGRRSRPSLVAQCISGCARHYIFVLFYYHSLPSFIIYDIMNAQNQKALWCSLLSVCIMI